MKPAHIENMTVVALQALQNGEYVRQHVLARLVREGYITVACVTNPSGLLGEREIVFDAFTEKGRKLLEHTVPRCNVGYRIESGRGHGRRGYAIHTKNE